MTEDQAAGEPIPMLLFCPKCLYQHIDSPKWERDPHDVEQGLICTWSNPPHKSHLCHACGNIWRPADVETTGVVCIQTKGKADTWDSTAPTTGSAPIKFAEYEAFNEAARQVDEQARPFREMMGLAASASHAASVLSDDVICNVGAMNGIARLTELLDDDQWNEIEPLLMKFARALLAASAK